MTHPDTPTPPPPLDLSGTWELLLDPKDEGLMESWQKEHWGAPATVSLPGSL